jgi:hypothetical protein
MDDSYRNVKNLNNTLLSKSSIPLGVYNTYNYPQSSHAVLNNFRSDFEDFSHYSDTSLKLNLTLFDSKLLDVDAPLRLSNKNIKFNDVKAPTYSKGLETLSSNDLENNPNQAN